MKKNNIEIKIMLASLLVVALISVTLFGLNSRRESENIDSTPTPENLTRDFNHKMGPDNAKVKIVEFYDPECEACSGFFPYVKEIVKRYDKDIQLITRYALYHGNSVLAAKASDAAALQGKFWDFQELLFLNQHEWSHKQLPAISYFIKYAQDLNLDVTKFKTDIEDSKRMDTISIDIEDSKKLGVNGTPTIFVNGKMLENISPSSFQELVESELKK